MTTTRNRRRNTTPDTPDTPAVDTTPDTPDTPAVDTTPTPDTPAVDTTTTTPDPTPDTPDTTTPTQRYVNAFITAARADGAPDESPALAVAAAVAAYAALPGGARGGARAAALAGAIGAGIDGGVVIRLNDTIPAAAATRTGTPGPDPVAVYTDRLTALLLAAETLPIPDGADVAAAYTAARDAIAGGGIGDGVSRAATAAVAAVSRGSGTHTAVDRRPLSAMPDGALTYAHRGTVHAANLSGGTITTADGSTFTNPTPAAQHVNGGVNVNGWHAWRYVADGASLHAVSVAPDTTPDGGDTTTA